MSLIEIRNQLKLQYVVHNEIGKALFATPSNAQKWDFVLRWGGRRVGYDG